MAASMETTTMEMATRMAQLHGKRHGQGKRHGKMHGHGKRHGKRHGKMHGHGRMHGKRVRRLLVFSSRLVQRFPQHHGPSAHDRFPQHHGPSAHDPCRSPAIARCQNSPHSELACRYLLLPQASKHSGVEALRGVSIHIGTTGTTVWQGIPPVRPRGECVLDEGADLCHVHAVAG